MFSLYRSQNLENIKTLFIIGNRIITNGNQPLKEALRKLEEYNFFSVNSDLLGDISTLAYISNLKNSLFELLILFLKGKLKNLPSNGTQSGFYLNLWKLCGYSYTFNVELATSYQNYQNDLSIHDSTMKKLVDLGIYENSSACATINWDNVLWNQTQIKNIVHLHGKCNYPISLILPTETIGSRALKES